MTKLEHLLQHPPAGMAGIASLYQWGQNYDSANNPFVLFLDLMGWSQEELGSTLFEGMIEQAPVEADLIAVALLNYANAPYDAYSYCSALLNAEVENYEG